MKTLFHLAIATAILSIGGVANAAPGYGPGHRDGGYRDGHSRYDHRGPVRHRPRMSLPARAQLKLKQLGYYRGPIDGAFGPGSKRALIRFQRDHRLPVTAWLDGRTQRALRL